MKVVITGGGGFLGSQLCEKLIELGGLQDHQGNRREIESIILLDAKFGPIKTANQVVTICGDISDRDTVQSAVGDQPNTTVFHLASMVSGECEDHFEDALRVNLDGGRYVFEAARRIGSSCKVIFASSIACFGGQAMRTPCTDHDKLTPQTTYGMTKAICELMINDYSRRGLFDGRSARLPTVIVRPGKPNAAASGWASGMFREPLHNIDCRLPVRRDQAHPMTGYRTVIDSLVAIHNLPASRLGDDRAIGLPAHRVTPLLAEQTLKQIAQADSLSIGSIVDAFDPRIQAIVDNWPTEIDGSRAIRLGIPAPPSLEEIVRQFLVDFVR